MAIGIDLAGTVTVVTGVTSGIGRGAAEVFAEAGSHVIGCGRRSEESGEARSFCEMADAHGVGNSYVSCDVSKEDGPAAVVEAARENFGRIDYVVSNAGRNVFTGVDKSRTEDWEACMHLNLRSHWLLAKAAGPVLAASAAKSRSGTAGKPGKPVFMINTSNHAYSTMPGCFPYNVAKAGLRAMVQSLAIEWGPRVRAVGAAPGFIDTKANADWFNSFPDSDAERRRTEELHPVGGIGTVKQLGGFFVFLSSMYAEFINGTTVLIDGGRAAIMQD